MARDSHNPRWQPGRGRLHSRIRERTRTVSTSSSPRAGWTRNYDVSTVSAVSAQKKDKLIQTGKVLVTCTLTIAGLGFHPAVGRSGQMSKCDDNGGSAGLQTGGQLLSVWAVIFTTCRRCGSISMGIGKPIRIPTLPQLGASEGGFGNRKDQPGLRSTASAKCNVGPSIRESRARSKAFGAFSAIQFTARYCGVSRERRRRTPSPTRSYRRMSQRRWNVPHGESARRTLWPSRSAIRNSSPCSIGLHIGSMTTISNLEALKHLVSELEGLAGQPAA